MARLTLNACRNTRLLATGNQFSKTAEPALSLPKARGFGQTPARLGESCRPCQILDNGKGLSGTTAAGADLVSGRRAERLQTRVHCEPVARPIADPVY